MDCDFGSGIYCNMEVDQERTQNDSYDNEINCIGAWVVCGIISFIFVTVTCVEIFDIIRALTIPEVVIYGFLKGLM